MDCLQITDSGGWVSQPVLNKVMGWRLITNASSGDGGSGDEDTGA